MSDKQADREEKPTQGYHIDRRFFIGSSLFSIACRQKNARGFRGFAFVANYDGQAIAAVDLQVFAVVRHIRLDANPTAVIAHPDRPQVFALTPANGAIHRIDLGTLNVEAKRVLARSATTVRLSPQGDCLWLLAAPERKLIRVDLDTLNPEAIVAIPEGATDIDFSPATPFAVLSLGENGRAAVIDLRTRRVAYQTQLGPAAGPVKYLKNGRLLLVGSPAERSLVVLDAESGRRVVELPLSLKPERFCFKQDGGQLFVTGPGLDAVAVVYPYQTQVAGTLLAGHAPGAMAASANPDFLFVANRDSGEVTALDIQTQKVRAVVPVGSVPDFIAITPDNNFALVLNRGSGDMAVIRVDAMAGRRTKAGPLFTMIPVGSTPVAAVVATI